MQGMLLKCLYRPSLAPSSLSLSLAPCILSLLALDSCARTVAAADDVGADDIEPVGVDRPSGSNEVLPPAGRPVLLVGACVGGRGQARVEEHRVGPVRVELAPRLVRDGERVDRAAELERERRRRDEAAVARDDLVVDGLRPAVQRTLLLAINARKRQRRRRRWIGRRWRGRRGGRGR